MTTASRQVIIVLGATGGLGTAIARRIAEHGAQVILVGRRADALRLTAAAIGHDSTVETADVTDEGSLEALCSRVIAAYGRVDVVINAAGADERKPLLTHTRAEIQRLIDVNLLGAILVTRAFLPPMQARRNGVILHLGGFADGRLAFPYYTVDTATRAGLRGFVDAVNREIDGSGVTVTFFCPAPADTEAERPFHAIWREMGTSIVTPQAVAAAVFDAVRQRKRIAIMGWTVRAFAALNAVSPATADCLLLRRYKSILQRHLAG
jgi:NADP-dependent 3-hydroxy acid dehydrogenase YdfG